MRIENRDGEGENYQVNKGVKAIYSDKEKKLVSLQVKGEEVRADKFYTLAIQGFHFKNSKEYLNITNEELLNNNQDKVLTTSAQQVLDEYLRQHQNLDAKVEGRLVYL